MNHKAIYNLYSNVTTIRGNIAYDSNDNVVEINENDVNNWTDPDQYKIDREEAYPSIGEQLDMQYHDLVNGTTTWKDAIAQVKADNPKPSE